MVFTEQEYRENTGGGGAHITKPCQEKHEEFGNLAKTHAILYA